MGLNLWSDDWGSDREGGDSDREGSVSDVGESRAGDRSVLSEMAGKSDGRASGWYTGEDEQRDKGGGGSGDTASDGEARNCGVSGAGEGGVSWISSTISYPVMERDLTGELGVSCEL